LEKIAYNGSMYKENKTGPKIEPWGTPYLTGSRGDEKLPISTEKVRSF